MAESRGIPVIIQNKPCAVHRQVVLLPWEGAGGDISDRDKMSASAARKIVSIYEKSLSGSALAPAEMAYLYQREDL